MSRSVLKSGIDWEVKNPHGKLDDNGRTVEAEMHGHGSPDGAGFFVNKDQQQAEKEQGQECSEAAMGT
jgi:hypothetical protein